MISKITIQNFKSIETIAIECSNLNVFTGLNGMGKSSIIQSLLLLRQSYGKGTLQTGGLSLNGDLVEIGVAKEALYEFADKEEITFNLDFDGKNTKSWTFAYEINNEGYESKYSESDIMPYSEDVTIPDNLAELALFKNGTFQYLNADRWVKNLYPMSDVEVSKNKNLGSNGQFTTHFLLSYGAKEIHKEICYPGTDVNSLYFQVSAWMNEISPKTKIIAEEIPGVNSIKLRYKFEGDRNTTSEIKPLNVGFGITYVLPVLVALLNATPGDILIIENPESHLHPQGQSSIGQLIALVANLGVQIFIETHSDHIINGICLAINKKNLDSSLIKFNYINKKGNEIVSTNYKIDIDASGRIDDSTLQELGIGFFDQIQKDLSAIMFGNK